MPTDIIVMEARISVISLAMCMKFYRDSEVILRSRPAVVRRVMDDFAYLLEAQRGILRPESYEAKQYLNSILRPSGESEEDYGPLRLSK